MFYSSTMDIEFCFIKLLFSIEEVDFKRNTFGKTNNSKIEMCPHLKSTSYIIIIIEWQIKTNLRSFDKLDTSDIHAFPELFGNIHTTKLKCPLIQFKSTEKTFYVTFYILERIQLYSGTKSDNFCLNIYLRKDVCQLHGQQYGWYIDIPWCPSRHLSWAHTDISSPQTPSLDTHSHMLQY